MTRNDKEMEGDVARRMQQNPSVPASEEKWRRVEIVMASSRDVPVLSANNILVNFMGNGEFLVSVVAAFPEPWLGGPKSPPPTRVEGKVLAKFSMNVVDWVRSVKGIAAQIERLQADGAFKLEEMVAEPQGALSEGPER